MRKFFERLLLSAIACFFPLAHVSVLWGAWGNVQEEYANETNTSGLIATIAVALVLFFIWWDKRSQK
ncbi:hypothetical protein LJC31_01935 [Synergistaceae bacterium OttesenSCG-928-I11]|nr:hypothetical protein [Synergistaceae bacterium OttesenSCG-928-I11]